MIFIFRIYGSELRRANLKRALARYSNLEFDSINVELVEPYFVYDLWTLVASVEYLWTSKFESASLSLSLSVFLSSFLFLVFEIQNVRKLH